MEISDSHLWENEDYTIASELTGEEWKDYLYEQFNALADILNNIDGSNSIITSLNLNLSIKETIANSADKTELFKYPNPNCDQWWNGRKRKCLCQSGLPSSREKSLVKADVARVA